MRGRARLREVAWDALASRAAASGAGNGPFGLGWQIELPAIQRQTLVGLGLNKMHRTRELEDTPAVRGMINKISYMLKVEE